MTEPIPVILGNNLFRKGMKVYMHKSLQMPQYVGVMHAHDFIEIVYVLSGQGVHIANGIETKASPGDMFLINYQIPHMFKALSDCNEPFIAYDLIFTPDFLDNSLFECHNFETLDASFLFQSLILNDKVKEYVHLVDSTFFEFRQIFERLYDEYTAQKQGHEGVMRANIIELIIKIFRVIGTESQKVKSSEDIVAMVKQYIKLHYSEPISLKYMSKRVFLSSDYLSRLIKKETGMSFAAYLQKYRIEQVCRLLIHTNETVEIIREKCGFHDAKFFYLSFKKHMGVTPITYRKSKTKSD